MKITKKIYITFPILLVSILTNGCSPKYETIAVSEAHSYDNNYGVVPDAKADSIIAQEIASENAPTEIDCSSCDPRYTTKIDEPLAPDEFLEKDWVPPKPKIYYKYMDDPKFYSEDELPENKFRTENAIIKIPKKRDKSLLYSSKN